MNSDLSYMNRNISIGNMKLIFDCRFVGYVVFVYFGNHLFVEFPCGINGPPRYYDFDDLYNIDPKTMQMISANYFAYAFADVPPATYYSSDSLESKLGMCGDNRTVANIKQVNNTGEFIYIINHVVYTAHFPVKWALDNQYSGFGPGVSNDRHCGNCNYYGSYRGVFIGYCCNCSIDHGLLRGYGFLDGDGNERTFDDIRDWYTELDYVICDANDAQSAAKSTYLQNVVLENIGYDSNCDTCLSGGPVPTTPDICDDQDDMDPVREYEDEYSSNISAMRESKQYPRRAYGIPDSIQHEVLRVITDNRLTPDFVRNKLEKFFADNGIKVTDNNYSFPIGYREEWDHYRTQKKPCYWYAWNIILRGHFENAHVQLRLYLANPPNKSNDNVEMVLACNTPDHSNEHIANLSMTLQYMGECIVDNVAFDSLQSKVIHQQSSSPIHSACEIAPIDGEIDSDSDSETETETEENSSEILFTPPHNPRMSIVDRMIGYCAIMYFVIIICSQIFTKPR